MAERTTNVGNEEERHGSLEARGTQRSAGKKGRRRERKYEVVRSGGRLDRIMMDAHDGLDSRGSAIEMSRVDARSFLPRARACVNVLQ